MAYDDDDPPLWLTVLKLAAIALVLIGGTGLLLWWFMDEMPADQPGQLDPNVSRSDWGVVGDNPLRPHR